MKLPDEAISTIRNRIATNACRTLFAVTALWDGARRHLHLSYFFNGRFDEVDFDSIMVGEVEISADLSNLETYGVSYVFDEFAATDALRSPHLVYQI